MVRLTEKAYGIAQIVKARTELNGEVCYYTCGDICKRQDSCRHGCPIQAILDRLAAYQDTGLTPEEVAELAKVKQEGRLVVLPKPKFKVGDMVCIVDAADHNWIGRVAKIVSVSSYRDCPISYELDIGGGDWLQSMLILEAELKEGRT